MKFLKAFISGILAGASIAIGGTAYLSLDNKILGALFFVVGLFTVCTFGLGLFTGKVCYVFDNNKRYALDTVIMWFGNLVGTMIIALLEKLTRFSGPLTEKAKALCDVKLSDDLLSIFVLAVFCNIMIFIAVHGYKNAPYQIGKYLALIFGVMVFILCGFEHCVANMYYITVANGWSGYAILFIIVNTLGNGVGGVIVPLVKKYILDRSVKNG